MNDFHTNEQAYRPHNCRVSRVLNANRYAARTCPARRTPSVATYSECVSSRPNPDPAETGPADLDYPGAELFLPPKGPGSLASLLRRALAAVIDWVIALLIVRAFVDTSGSSAVESFAPLGLFLLMHLVLVGTLGSTIGHKVVGLQVIAQNGQPAPLKQVLIRTLLVGVFFPAIFTANDGRGFHDKAAGTMTLLGR